MTAKRALSFAVLSSLFTLIASALLALALPGAEIRPSSTPSSAGVANGANALRDPCSAPTHPCVVEEE
jgi:hypothetical protein